MTNQLELIQDQKITPGFADYLESVIIWLQEFLYWWYLQVPVQLFRLIKRFGKVADDSLSFTLVAGNVFRPWHRDPSMAGWVVGIVVKMLYLPVAALIMSLGFILLFIFLVAWVFLPPLVLVYILLGPILA